MKTRLIAATIAVAAFGAAILGVIAMGDRHDVCRCADGETLQGFASALTSRETHCSERCRDHGGGEWIGRWSNAGDGGPWDANH